MNTLDLTVQVLNLSPKVTLRELNIYFSYCGTVDKIDLSRNKDQSQTALVTFVQPYAFQTALLLNDAIFAGQPIQVLPANSPIPDKLTVKNKEKQGICNGGMQALASRGVRVLNKTKEELDETYKLSEKGRLLVDQTRALVYAAELTASNAGHWLSSALDKASKRVSELGTNKKDNPNSREQK